MEDVGLKCGLEVHQQLLTKHKLFCRCSAMFEEEPRGSVKRVLRAVAGETGEVDTAAAFEAAKAKAITYMTYPSESCLVELDEEPIGPMNTEALHIALQIALMLNCTMPDEIEVMRKAVLDGSNTSGFQRTAVVGIGGYVSTKAGRVGIQSVAIEEDACQILDRAGNVFGLNRLGIPLVEIATEPDIKTPEQAREAAETIGRLMQSTERVRRGLGTIRQDLNVSISGGARCELKGVQELGTIPMIIKKEMERQESAIMTGKKVTQDVRRVKPDLSTEFMRPMPGAARMYPETDATPIDVTKDMLSSIKLAEGIDERIGRFVSEYGISKEIAGQLFGEGKAMLFERLVKLGAEPSLAAGTLTSIFKSLKREGVPVEKLGERQITGIFRSLGKSANKDNVRQALESAAKHPEMEIEALAGPSAGSGEEVRNAVREILKSNPQAMNAPNPQQALMGLVMAKLRGKAQGALVMRILQEELKDKTFIYSVPKK